jgi:hypothetical protein
MALFAGLALVGLGLRGAAVSWMAEGGYRVFLRFRPRLQAWARKVSGERKA